MKRMLVKPIGGKFNYICSSEWIFELIDDPRVKTYMKIEQTTGKLWSTGEPFDLFELKFIPTMLDEFAYPDTEFPGVFEDSDGNEYALYYAVEKTGDGDYRIYYCKVGSSGKSTKQGVTYLSDGTAVEDKVEWAKPDKSSVIYEVLNKEGEVLDNNKTADQVADWLPLPVMRGILFGDEAMVKLNVEGVSDAPKMIIKPLGSSGVADPLDQRQSVGFRVDGFGLAIKRPEAVCVTYGLCRNAALAALAYSTADVVYGDYTLMDNGEYKSGQLDYSGEVNSIDTENNEQLMHVDGVNSKRVFVKFNNNTNYSEGTFVKYGNKYYVFTTGHNGEWDVTHVKEVNPNIVE
jgi:hypothetical protein